MMHLRRTPFAAVLMMSITSAVSHAADKTLDIDPTIQQTPVWCWIAVSQMVFEHFGVENVNPAGNYQCGIVGAIAAPGTRAEACEYSCFQNVCIVPAGSASTIVSLLKKYPKEAATAPQSDQTGIKANHLTRVLSASETVTEINGGRPIIAGINPSGRPAGWGTSEHVALIIGYEEDGGSLIVNDPAPYAALSWSNPYEAAGGEIMESGQYRISREDFINGLQWGESIKVREDGTAEPDDLPEFCCIPMAGRFGPYPNPGPNGIAVRRGHACSVPYVGTGRACD